MLSDLGQVIRKLSTNGRGSYCLLRRKFCTVSHSWPDIALLLMVIRLMAHSDFLLLDLTPELVVGVLAVSAVYGLGMVLEDAPHLLEQTVYR